MTDVTLSLTITVIAFLIIAGIYLYMGRKITSLEANMNNHAQERFQSWREKEINNVRSDQQAIARREANTEKQKWQIEYEATIRADAIMRSQAVITGKVTENLAPYMAVFPYNPKDVRFVGSPIDLIVFDGAAEGQLREVIFLEVKTSTARLNQIQRQIKEAVIGGRVQWRELRINAR